jgi:hypothetical protein
MSYNGSGTFQINTSGQPVVTGTVISSTAFNALTADLANGLSTAITKDGQTATTVRIPFAQGITSTLVTDSTSVSTGSIITAGGIGVAKALNVGSATDSTSTSTGSIVTAGGVGIAKALSIGTTLSVTGNSTFTGFVNTPNTFGFKNRIINGAMVIDQRNNGAEVNPAVAATYYLDRWLVGSTVASKFKIGQNAGAVTPPTGYINYLGCTSLSAYTVGAAETFNVQQRIEGLNVADLSFGTASAATITLSFWVYSSLTGTFGGAVKNSGSTRSYPFTYTISSANTWTQASVTIAGDTTGTWLTTNGIGVVVVFSIGTGTTQSGTAGAWAGTNYNSATGAVSVVGTSGATFYITGVQFEKGSTATSFDYRSYGTELALCQRYYQIPAGFMAGGLETSTIASFAISFAVTLRAIPTFTAIATTADIRINGSTTSGIAGTWGNNNIGVSAAGLNFTRTAGTWTAGTPAFLNQTANVASFAAEL